MEWNTHLMNRRTQVCVFGAILGLASFLPGCEQGNEKAAKIEGSVPTDGLSPEERLGRMKGASQGSMQSGYPGSKAPAPAKK